MTEWGCLLIAHRIHVQKAMGLVPSAKTNLSLSLSLFFFSRVSHSHQGLFQITISFSSNIPVHCLRKWPMCWSDYSTWKSLHCPCLNVCEPEISFTYRTHWAPWKWRLSLRKESCILSMICKKVPSYIFVVLTAKRSYVIHDILPHSWHGQLARWHKWSACEIWEAMQCDARVGKYCRAPSVTTATSYLKWAEPLPSPHLHHTTFPTLMSHRSSYITGTSLTSPGEPPMILDNKTNVTCHPCYLWYYWILSCHLFAVYGGHQQNCRNVYNSIFTKCNLAPLLFCKSLMICSDHLMIQTLYVEYYDLQA